MSLTERNIAIGMLIAGAGYREVAEYFHRDATTIRRLHHKYNTTHITADRPRSGRPPVFSDRQKKIIRRIVRKTPKIHHKKLIDEAMFMIPSMPPLKRPCRRTLYRVLAKLNIHKYQCKGRPKLTAEHVKARYAFAQRYRQFPWHRRTIKFSDECSIQKGSGHQREWCFRYPDEKWKANMITELTPLQGPQQMSLVASESAGDRAFRNSCFPRLCGKNVLLLIDTEDASQVKMLKYKVRTDVEGDNLSILSHAPGVPIKQAYNEQGIKVLADYIEVMVGFVGQNRELIQTRDIASIVIGSIQGYTFAP
ncbi:hypothetical protein yc1106_06623 [Curvularia clavata]|uniref:Transposase Tc1-like domain-containing protein n=1 Tax=Curvularia clavata TaxID=95742 RepID=A0A9Q8ZB36_CURCL|nr:hypothetical protein yc1106_06623 [Curvularia clavata]